MHFQLRAAGGHCLTEHAHMPTHAHTFTFTLMCTVVPFLTFNTNMDPAVAKRSPLPGDIYLGLAEIIS